MKHVYVQPGELYVASEPCEFKTILGSCISVCLWDPVRRAGGLNHFVLPDSRGETLDARFGDVAIPRLIERLRRLDCHQLVAKVFGGASVMGAGRGATVGDSNAAVAIALLQANHIEVVARRTGGVHGISLRFQAVSGEVKLRQLKAAAAERKEGLLF